MSDKVILIIDDEDEVCRVVKEGLERLDSSKVLAANNGKDGLHIAKKSQPDLILLDIGMPSMNGFQVLELLKEDHETYHIPVVMLTAENEDAFKITASRLYSEDYITKPTSVMEVKNKIDPILARFGK